VNAVKKTPKKNFILVAVLVLLAFIIGIASYTLLINSKTNQAETVLKKYLKSNSWEERLKYVRKPEVVKPLMQTYYEKTDLVGGKEFLRLEFEKNFKVEEMKTGEWVNIRVVFREGKNGFGATIQDSNWYALQLTKSGYKIDWEASVVYNPMTFKAMEAQKPSEPQKFRVLAELANYYNWEFSGGEKYFYSIKLAEPNTSEHLTGYLKRDSPDGQRIYELLKDGQEHPIIVKIRYPISTRSVRIVIIDEFLQEYFNEP